MLMGRKWCLSLCGTGGGIVTLQMRTISVALFVMVLTVCGINLQTVDTNSARGVVQRWTEVRKMNTRERERLLRMIGYLEGLMIATDQDAIANGLETVVNELDSLLEGEKDA